MSTRPSSQTSKCPAGKLPHFLEDGQRCGNRIESEERLERVKVDLPAGKRPQLGGERELAVDRTVVERLDPEAVPREHEPPPARVPDRDGEHPAQALCELFAVLFVEMEHHFGVAVRPEVMSGALQLVAQLAVVVDLTVLDDVEGAVLVGDRLVARLEVDDRETPRGEGDVAVAELPEAVRAAMNQCPAHLCDAIRHGGAVRRRDSADPAHGASV